MNPKFKNHLFSDSVCLLSRVSIEEGQCSVGNYEIPSGQKMHDDHHIQTTLTQYCQTTL